MEFLKKFRRGFLVKNSIAIICAVVFVSSLLVVVISMLRLPEVPWETSMVGSYRALSIMKVSEEKLGVLGKMMVEMLPDDLAFTVFVPSEKAFEHDLKLRANDSLVQKKANDTYAILSRILGFSAVSRNLPSDEVPYNTEVSFDSISGFKLDISKNSDGTLVVNRVRSRWTDLRKGEIVLHIMNGVIMDREFEQSVQPDNED